jgi:hypothetical protein
MEIIEREKYILKKIELLFPKEIITLIYDFMSIKSKIFCNKKYEFLEKNIKNDLSNNYRCWSMLECLIKPLDKKQIRNFVNKGAIKNNEFVIKKVWYHSKQDDSKYSGYDLLTLWWSTDVLYIDYYIKNRLIYGIYYYIIHTIQLYDLLKKKLVQMYILKMNQI